MLILLLYVKRHTSRWTNSMGVDHNGFGWLAYCGRYSLPIYLAFVIPMAASRELLARTDFANYPDLMMILVLFIAILVPLVLERAVRGRRLGFLFSQPAWARAFITREGT
jgi:uncharacterized membrane protein YcfT